MFEVGESYKTQEGRTVKIVEEQHVGTAYHCVCGDDGVWRYARKSDAGRVTASAIDMSCPRNLIPPEGTLWCVHILGPDSMMPAKDLEEAKLKAAEFNRGRPEDMGDVLLTALPSVWPFSKEAHEKELAKGVDWSDVG